MAVFGISVYLAQLYFRLYANALDFDMWDMRTITINDYTVEYPISSELWTEFLEYEKFGTGSTTLIGEHF